MKSRQSRSLTVFDLMIITAASGVGCYAAVSYYRHWIADVSNLDRFLGQNEFSSPWLTSGIGLFLTALTLGFLIIRLRSPRPSIRRLALVPANTPYFILVVFLFIIVPLKHTTHRLEVFTPPAAQGARYYNMALYFAGFLVQDFGLLLVPAWLLLLIARRWRLRGWIDWCGVIIGLLWIALAVYDAIVHPWISWRQQFILSSP